MRDQGFRPRQGLVAEVGVADDVHDQRMRRQRRRGVPIFDVNHRDGEQTVIQPLSRRHVAQPHRSEQQHRRGRPDSPIALSHDRAPGEALSKMRRRPFVPERSEYARQSLMSLRKIGIEVERRFVLFPRLFEFAILDQYIAEVDPSDRMGRMAAHRLAIAGARRGAMSAGEGERAEIVQRLEMGRVEPQRLDKGRLRRLVVAAPGQSAGAPHGLVDLAVRVQHRISTAWSPAYHPVGSRIQPPRESGASGDAASQLCYWTFPQRRPILPC